MQEGAVQEKELVGHRLVNQTTHIFCEIARFQKLRVTKQIHLFNADEYMWSIQWTARTYDARDTPGCLEDAYKQR